MNTRFRIPSLLAVALGTLLAASTVSAGVAERLEGKVRGHASEMKESHQSGRQNQAPPRAPRQTTQREPAPRERSAPQERAPRERYTARNDSHQGTAPREARGRESRGNPDRGNQNPGNPGPGAPGRGGPGQGGNVDGKPDMSRGGGTAWNNRGKDEHGGDNHSQDNRGARNGGGNVSGWNGNNHGGGTSPKAERDRWDASRYARPGVAQRPGIAYRAAPRIVTSLPVGHRSYNWNGGAYYHYGSHWYRPYGTRYVMVGAPYGMFVSYLPGYYNSFWFGGVRYFHADSTYYLYEPARQGYVVTQSPYGDSDDDEASGSSSVDEDLYVYPAQGQSEQQQADDRYECHRWAVGETGYDPTDSEYDADRRADYLRALTACLTGRGYSVR